VTIATSHLETLVIARVGTAPQPLAPEAIAAALRRFAPTTETDGAWNQRVAAAVHELTRRGVQTSQELITRLGKGKTWQQVADRVLPAVALGIRHDDKKSHARLAGRDDWAAAVVARALGLWTSGPPPSVTALCDALVWRALALPDKPKRCPEEVRAHAVYRELPGTPIGNSARGLRLIAAREVGAQRPDLRALRDALVRMWLEERALGRDFAGDVRVVARGARDGVFGDRKVFIASVWHELRRQPPWSALSLDDFKARLLLAHRAGDVELARADLVAAMNPELVASSETRTDGASFHFIVREAST
jgi:hypothetical protein